MVESGSAGLTGIGDRVEMLPDACVYTPDGEQAPRFMLRLVWKSRSPPLHSDVSFESPDGVDRVSGAIGNRVGALRVQRNALVRNVWVSPSFKLPATHSLSDRDGVRRVR